MRCHCPHAAGLPAAGLGFGWVGGCDSQAVSSKGGLTWWTMGSGCPGWLSVQEWQREKGETWTGVCGAAKGMNGEDGSLESENGGHELTSGAGGYAPSGHGVRWREGGGPLEKQSTADCPVSAEVRRFLH